jgi:type IV secretion system protein VirB4
MTSNSATKWFSKSRPGRELFPIDRFVDDWTFSTKTGGYGAVFSLRGIDGEGLTREHLDSISGRVSRALRSLPDGSTLYQYTLKRRGFPIPAGTDARQRERAAFLDANARFGELALFWCVYVPIGRIRKAQEREQRSNKSLSGLRRSAQLIQEQLSDIVPMKRLTKDEIGWLFSYLLTLELHLAKPKLRSRQYVDRQLAGASLSWSDDYLKIGHRYAQVFSLRESPKKTRPNALSGLLSIDAEMVLCSTWTPKTADQTRKEVSRQEGFLALFKHNAVTVLAHLGTKKEPPRSASTIAADHSTDTLGGVLVEVENQGRQYGHYSLIGVVHGLDLNEIREAMPQVHKAFKDPSEAAIIEETLGALCGYQAMFPGNAQFDVRRRWLQDGHVVNLSSIYAPFTGNPISDAIGEYLALYETRDRAPFFFDPYHNGLRGLLVLGAPGRGKSINGNFLVDHEQRFDGFTYIFDIGGSYESTVLGHGGTITRVGIQQSLGNPFALRPTEENLQFLFRFVRLLISSGGVSLSGREENDLAAKVRQMYALAPNVRRLKYLANLLPEATTHGLSKWIDGGVYGSVFDNTDGLLHLSRLQVFEFQDVDEEHKDLIEPSLFWITRLANSVIHNPANLGVPKHLLFDEIWKQLKNPQLLDMVLGSLKTGRKHHAGVTLLTHVIDDLGAHARLIKNACPMVLFLGDPTFDRAQYAEFFDLNEQELDNIASLQPREIVLKTPDYSKILVLNLDPKAYARYTTKPRDRMRRQRLIEEHGFERGIELFAAGAA